MSGKKFAAVLSAVTSLIVVSCGDNQELSPSEKISGASCSNLSGDMGEGNDVGLISLSPTATEMVYAIGAGDQVIAVDNMSNYPEVAGGAESKLSGFEPNVEAIAGMEPDVVLISHDPGDLASQLDGLGIDTWTGYAAMTLDEAYAQITELGALTGHEDGAERVINCMKSAIKDITTSVVDANSDPEEITYYYELDDTYYSITSNTFIGQMFKLLGLTSVADGVEDGNDWPQLNIEKIVSSDPDFIFLADTKCCGQNAATVAARPGWSEMNAVLGNKIVELDDDVASRWGPRVVDLLATVADAIKKSAA